MSVWGEFDRTVNRSRWCGHVYRGGKVCNSNPQDHVHGQPVKVDGVMRRQCRGRHHRFVSPVTPDELRTALELALDGRVPA